MESLNLSQEELRTYPRWYTDLLLRKGKQNSVEIDDLTSFLENFGLKEEDRQSLIYLFDPPLSTLDPTAFYIFIRLVSHVMQGEQPEPRLIYSQAPVPQPKSILSRKRKNESTSAPGSARSSPAPGNPFRKNNSNNNNVRPTNNAEKPKLDIDSFKTFILTGSMPEKDRDSEDETGSRPKKRVSFNPDPPQVAEAAARSMEELMRQRQLHSGQQGYLAPPLPQFQQQVDPMEHYDNDYNGSNQEEEEEEDVEIDTSAFQNVNIDSVLHHGVSNVPPPEASFRFHPSNSPSPQPEAQQTQGFVQPTHNADNKPPPPPPPPPSRRAGSSIGQSPSPIPQSQSMQNLPQFTPTSFPQSPSLNQLSTNNGFRSDGAANVDSLQPQHTNNSMPQLSQLQPQYTNNNMQQPLQQQYTNNIMPQLQPQHTTDTLPTIAPPPPQPRRNRNPPPVPGYPGTGPNQQMAPPPPPPPRRKSAHMGPPSSVASSPGMTTDVPGFQPLQQPQTTSAPDLLADLRALQEEVDRLRYR